MRSVFAENCVAVVFVMAILLNLVLPKNMENEVAECKYLKDITDDEETNNELYKICTSEDLEDAALSEYLVNKSIKIITKEDPKVDKRSCEGIV